MSQPRIHTLPKGEHIAPMPAIRSHVAIRMTSPGSGKIATKRDRIIIGTRPDGSNRWVAVSHRLGGK